ncbi:hypothetical protein EGN72_10680 [Pseudorhodobacter sp. E13]|uniref:hypothetical protein n=1 Tax=Pseudorhodobacter sp. E13 TaxID=2487931 RepID=UPI000F8E68CA|nr:hypothetical protein [Pseudorhodobacter sp. E13]RUS60246.1 hypothetical protein EGN72_10680 [Pseudorhodobacter sp. E13]
MINAMKMGAGLVAATVLSGCVAGEHFEGTERYRGASSVIATGQDQGRDTGVLNNGRAAIAYDPDGCQNWIIDDGLEGYSSPRYDPVSGLPICNDYYPPGTVIRDYQSSTEGIEDRVSGHGRKTVVVRR